MKYLVYSAQFSLYMLLSEKFQWLLVSMGLQLVREQCLSTDDLISCPGWGVQAGPSNPSLAFVSDLTERRVISSRSTIIIHVHSWSPTVRRCVAREGPSR